MVVLEKCKEERLLEIWEGKCSWIRWKSKDGEQDCIHLWNENAGKYNRETWWTWKGQVCSFGVSLCVLCLPHAIHVKINKNVKAENERNKKVILPRKKHAMLWVSISNINNSCKDLMVPAGIKMENRHYNTRLRRVLFAQVFYIKPVG